MKKLWLMAALCLASSLSLASQASADILAASTREAFSSDISTSPGVYTTLRLDDTIPGATSLSFTAPAAGPVQITYSADCAVSTPGDIVLIQVLVDGTAIGPGGGTVWRFCSDTVSSTSTRVVAPTVSAGAHSVSIIASGVATIRRTVITVAD